MDEFTLARALHIIGVVMWIGGVSMVTTILLPSIRRSESPRERVSFFEAIEGRFAWQARFTTLLTGLSGFYMMYELDAWDRYASAQFWWVHAMTLVWILFTLMLFLFEPLFLHRWFLRRAEVEPERTFLLIQVMHWVLLAISLVTIFGAVIGSH